MDEIDDLLKPKREADSAHRRDAIFAQTATVLRNRRWARTARRVGVGAACFAAGVALTLWLKQQPAPIANDIVRAPEPAPIPQVETPSDPYRNDPPARIERWAAMADGEKRVALYRRAGDLHLTNGDQLAALRCYRHALQSAGADDLIVQPEKDTWLYMSMKMDRQKEFKNARN